VRAHSHVPLAAAALVGVERQFDAFGPQVPLAANQCQVVLFSPAFAQLQVQVAQRSAAPGPGSASIRPKSVALPPCTARPGGLLMTMRSLSS
jgi:hypothetical protein